MPLAEMLTAEREAHAATRRELEALRERVDAAKVILQAEIPTDGCDCPVCMAVDALTKGEKR